MIRKTLLPFVFTLMTLSVQAQPLPHMDLNMTGPEYRHILAGLEYKQGFLSKRADDPLLAILDLGKRNMDWIETINQNRDAGHKLELTTPETTAGYPIETPRFSNRTIIINDLTDLKDTMPKEMAQVIFGDGALPGTNPIDDETFIKYARLLNRIYEAASRWLLQEPWLAEYSELSVYDIRGYYYLQNDTDLERKLSDWNALDDTEKNKYSAWLFGECRNSFVDAEFCQTDLEKSQGENTVLNFHQRYVDGARELYNSFFELQNPRPEAMWSSGNPDVMSMPFTDPDNQAVREWFKVNVEDEFQFGDWSLHIQFKHADNLAKVVFEPGATPHVNELGGDVITMDANPPLNEYGVRWTIRHEFGHILGFPDCYVEFYDTKNAVMVSYQLDITNLMCSRRGHLQEKHYEQLKKHYYK